MTIEVVLLGTGNPLPDPNRAGAATLVRAGNRTLLFDAGRGVCMRMAAAGTLYDVVDYPSRPYSATHPDRLATIARLHGVPAADPRRCRLLELGCSDGGNLFAMAVGLPGSAFVGIDFAASSIDDV